jgi:hypothetical protein
MTSGPMSPPAAMPLHTMSAAKLEGAHTHSRAAGAARRSNCIRGRGGKSRSDRACPARSAELFVNKEGENFGEEILEPVPARTPVFEGSLLTLFG